MFYIRHLGDQRVAGYFISPDIRTLLLMCLSARSDLTDGQNNFICHLITCPVLPASLLVCFLHYLRDTVSTVQLHAVEL
jgi:hypothetical protein